MTTENEFDWTVVGAGPSGIAAVGKLIDNHVEPKRIAWIDPSFMIGDFGTKWDKVPSNTQVSLFLKFLNASKAFDYSSCPENFALHSLTPSDTCELSYMVHPLQWVSQVLRKKVFSEQNSVQSLKMKNRNWQVTLSNGGSLLSKNVILAIGAEAKNLSYPHLKIIPLEIALNKEKLSKYCIAEDKIAVFGSSHSAVLIIRNLLESCFLEKVINFYQSPLCYAVYLDDMILFDNTGLKGTTAVWAKENLHGNLPDKLERFLTSEKNLQNVLPQCSHVIYAIGFQKRSIPIDGLHNLNYNSKTGIIAPGLFGVGIAFPESSTDRFGVVEYRVGLWKFMNYITNILPLWLNYSA